MSTARRGEINLVKILMFCVLGVVGYWAWAFLPNHWTAMKMEEVMQVTLLYWRDRPDSQDKVQGIYTHELDVRGIPESFAPEWCTLYDYPDELHMECWWEYTIQVPLLGPRLQEFYIHKYVDTRAGEIYDVSNES